MYTSSSETENSFTANAMMGAKKCNHCDFASVHVGDLKRHLKTHSGDKTYKCNQCNYSTARGYSLKMHLKTHSGEKSYKMTVHSVR